MASDQKIEATGWAKDAVEQCIPIWREMVAERYENFPRELAEKYAAKIAERIFVVEKRIMRETVYLHAVDEIQHAIVEAICQKKQ